MNIGDRMELIRRLLRDHDGSVDDGRFCAGERSGMIHYLVDHGYLAGQSASLSLTDAGRALLERLDERSRSAPSAHR